MTLSDRSVQRLRQLVIEAPRPPERYELHEVIGKGGMGTVYRARDRVLNRDVAIKVLDDRGDLDLGASARLLRESYILASLEHPGIVPVHDAGELENGGPYYVMQLVRGKRLDEHAAGGISRGDALRLMLRLAEIVAFTNDKGIVHRDLKPANVMIGPFGEVLVLDWGIAKVLTRDSVENSDPSQARSVTLPANGSTDDGVVVGTPGYMAPEQAAGSSARVDQTADVYSLGVIMRELLQATRDGSSRPLNAIVGVATAHDPHQRYASATQFSEDIRRWLDGLAVSAHKETPAERVLRAYRAHQTAVLLVMTYLIVRVIILLWRHI